MLQARYRKALWIFALVWLIFSMAGSFICLESVHSGMAALFYRKMCSGLQP